MCVFVCVFTHPSDEGQLFKQSLTGLNLDFILLDCLPHKS